MCLGEVSKWASYVCYFETTKVAGYGTQLAVCFDSVELGFDGVDENGQNECSKNGEGFHFAVFKS